MKVPCLSKPYTLKPTDALLITDIQNDFLPGGALPVENGDEIIPVINNYTKRFQAAHAYIVASRDWHPQNHISFTTQGGPWPPHCVQNTQGAQFNPDLKLSQNVLIISKATDPKQEAYSAFDGTALNSELQKLGVKRLFVCGLATDYCVVNTVLDACKLGFEVVVLMDATLGIDVQPGDVDRAVAKMMQNGAQQATTVDFPDGVDTLPTEKETPDALSEKTSMIRNAKKKARMRSKGANKRIRSER
jgi:nicotinamidase/pyrazinamidase